jgi:hypothetical protein
MTTSEELSSFVKDALGRGLPPAQIEDVLLRAGWTHEQVRAALARFAQFDFPIPVPRPKPYLSAREAFQYLIQFTTLYISAYYLGNLFFQIIDRLFPDPANPAVEYYIRQAIRWSVSSLVVAFPVFLYVSWVTNRAIRTDANKRSSKVRRWLTYLTLFVAASFLIGDFITLVYNLLGGELTVRFVLKVLTIAVIAGTTFWYYLSDLRLDEREVGP